MNLGPVLVKNSKRKFEDISKYKYSLEQKIGILRNQNKSIEDIWSRIKTNMLEKLKYHESINDKIRINHNTPNRCVNSYKNFPKISQNKIKEIYESLM